MTKAQRHCHILRLLFLDIVVFGLNLSLSMKLVDWASGPESFAWMIYVSTSFYGLFSVHQERRRSERAEIQRVRAEKEKDRQNRIAVKQTSTLKNAKSVSVAVERHRTFLMSSQIWHCRKNATEKRKRRPRRRLTTRPRRRKFCPAWGPTLEASWPRLGGSSGDRTTVTRRRVGGDGT